MAFIPYPDGVLAVVEQQIGDVEYTNTLWFELLAMQNHDIQELADWLLNWFGTNVMPNLATAAAVTNVRCYRMDTPESLAVDSTGAAIPGGVAAAPAPISAALVTTFYTGDRGRSSRGRNYVAGWTEDDVDVNSVIDPILTSNVQDAYLYLMDNVQLNSSYFWVVASRYFEGAPRAVTVGKQINNVEVRSTILGTQRRRIDRA